MLPPPFSLFFEESGGFIHKEFQKASQSFTAAAVKKI